MALQGHRNDVIIASKVQERLKPGPNGGGPDGAGLSRMFIMQQIERTLRRLGTDHVDIYYAHHPDLSTPMDHTIRAFDDLIHQGKVLYWALSTYPAWQLTEAVLLARQYGWYEPVCHQIGYNLTARQVERETLPAAQKFGISHTVFSPLAGGLLTGMKATQRAIVGVQRWMAGSGPGYSPEHIIVAEQMEALGQKWDHTPSNLALAWLLSRPTIASAIIGPETITELEENVRAVDVQLDAAQMAELNEVGKHLPAPAFSSFQRDPLANITPASGL